MNQLINSSLYDKLNTRLEEIIKSNVDNSAQLRLIQIIASNKKYTNFVDLGTREGNSLLALVLAAIKNEGFVYTIDVEKSRILWEDAESAKYFHKIIGDDLGIEIPFAEIDVLSIDTSHTYEHTLKELAKWVPKIRSGGVVLLHDTISHPTVVSAIKYFIFNKDYTFINDAAQNGMGVIYI